MSITGIRLYKYEDDVVGKWYFPVYLCDNTGTSFYPQENLQNYLVSYNVNWAYPIGLIGVGTESSFTSYTSDIDNSEGLSVTNTTTTSGTTQYLHTTFTLDNVVGTFSSMAQAPDFAISSFPAICYNEDMDYVFTSTNLVPFYIRDPSTSSVYYTNISVTSYPNEKFGSGFNKGFLNKSIIYYGYQFDNVNVSRSNTNVNYARKLMGMSVVIDENDPYKSGGDSPDPDDGGDGNFDYNSDDIPEPDLPTVSVTDSGMVTLYAPTEAQLKSLADFLWSEAFSLESFKKIVNDPMDCILGLNLISVNVPHGTAREITVGNIVSTVSCDTCPTQYIKVDCGTFTFSKSSFTNSFLDWSPYTKCYLYLPYIGCNEISIDEVMGTTVHVTYHVDILSGACFAYVISDGRVLYEYMGQCAESVPLSSTSYSQTISGILNASAAIGGVVATAVTGGAAAPVAMGLLAHAGSATAQAASSLKPSVSHSGAIGGGAGIMGVNYPYLIFITPRTKIPSKQYSVVGTPSNTYHKLSDLSGFNVISSINLSVKGATDQECREIENILHEGVIL